MSVQANKNSRALPTWMARARPYTSRKMARRTSASLLGPQWWKRASDVVLSLVGLIFVTPLMVIVAPLIKLTSPGPIIYKQERLGLNRRLGDRRANRNGISGNGDRRRRADRRDGSGFGKPFTMYKLRTMQVDAEGDKPRWAAGPNDPRVTPLGRFLRKSRMDEVPQFLNVLRGEMSIVGPRPEREHFFAEADKEIPNFKHRLRAKPGITGLAQVKHGYTNSVKGLEGKLKYDLQYLDQMSAATDAKIMLKSISVVITGRGAF